MPFRLDYFFIGWFDNDRQQNDGFAIEGEQAVAAPGVVHECVTWAAFFDMTLIRKSKVARNNVIQLLPLVLGEVNRLVLVFFDIGNRDEEWLRECIAKMRRLV